METKILSELLSEHGLAIMLLLLILYGLYRLAKPFLSSYLRLIEKRDEAFIGKIGEIVLEVKSGGNLSKIEHYETRELIKYNHKELVDIIKK